MRENYGLLCFWDADNNCFVAFSPDYELCRGTGSTQTEAVADLDTAVQEWIATGRQLGADVPLSLLVLQEPSPQPQTPQQEKPNRKARNTPLKALREAMEAAKAAALTYSSLDLTITLDPCVVHIRGRVCFPIGLADKEKFFALTSHQDNIIFDLSEVAYMDSSGLGLLFDVRKRMSASRGSLCIVVSGVKNDPLERMFRITRFDSFMPVFYSLKEAKALVQENSMTA